MKKEVYLTPQELEEIGYLLGRMRDDLEIINKAIDFIPSVEEKRVQENPLFMYRHAHSFLGSLFIKTQRINSELDHCAALLLCATSKRELDYSRNKGKEIAITKVT